MYIFFCPTLYRFRARLRNNEVSRMNLRILRALRNCGTLIHLMAFLCCRVHRSLGSRSNFRSASPVIVSRKSSTFCRPNTTGILFFSYLQTCRLQSIEDLRTFVHININIDKKDTASLSGDNYFRQSWQFVLITRP